jgi:hypothetical protein
VIGEGSTSKISKIKRRVMLPNETEPNEYVDDVYFALKEIDFETMVRAEFLDELENETKLLKALVSAQACYVEDTAAATHLPQPTIHQFRAYPFVS